MQTERRSHVAPLPIIVEGRIIQNLEQAENGKNSLIVAPRFDDGREEEPISETYSHCYGRLGELEAISTLLFTAAITRKSSRTCLKLLPALHTG